MPRPRQTNQANGIATVATVPMLGWLPKNGTRRACSYSVKKYGAQQKQAPDNPDCGNGVTPGGRVRRTGGWRVWGDACYSTR